MRDDSTRSHMLCSFAASTADSVSCHRLTKRSRAPCFGRCMNQLGANKSCALQWSSAPSGVPPCLQWCQHPSDPGREARQYRALWTTTTGFRATRRSRILARMPGTDIDVLERELSARLGPPVPVSSPAEVDVVWSRRGVEIALAREHIPEPQPGAGLD